jgi:hypothetical protein
MRTDRTLNTVVSDPEHQFQTRDSLRLPATKNPHRYRWKQGHRVMEVIFQRFDFPLLDKR